MEQFEMINKLKNIIDMIKDFGTGYTTKNHKAIIIWYKDSAYKVTFEKVDSNKDPLEVIRDNLE